MSHFVGKLISIVDTKSVRYVGILGSISAETSSLVLNNVKIYGTESRVDENDSKNRVLPESGRRDSIVFKGSDVEDLQVIETDPLDAVSSDSEPKSASTDRHHSTTTPNKTSKEHSGRSDKRKGHKQSTSNNANESTENRSESPVERESSPSEEEFDEEDFVARTQKLVLDDKPHQTFEKVYNKSSSFFDNLGDGEEEKPVRRFSSERGGRGGSRGGRGGNRGGGRGGFRGGRGGGRGGRGGNHQYGNHHNDSHGSSEFVPRSSQPTRGRGGSRGGPRGGKPKGSVESSSGADEFIPGRLA